MNKIEKLKSKKVLVKKLYLDINNPRLSISQPVGYDDVEKIFCDETQDILSREIYDKFVKTSNSNDNSIEDSMIAQGWVPDASPLVYLPDEKLDKYVVVEGNRRLATLRKIHNDFLTMNESDDKYERVKAFVESTSSINVSVIDVNSSKELEEYLVHFLSVRHIIGIQEWTPHARNLFFVNLYKKLGGSENDKLVKKDILKEISAKCGLTDIKARRVLQQAFMFEQFKSLYRTKLKGTDEFKDQDQQFFEQIVSDTYLRETIFKIDIDTLLLPPESMEKLFNGSFFFDRRDSDEHSNQIFHTAKSWKKYKFICQFDADHGTSLSSLINLDEPKKSKTIRYVENKKEEFKRKSRPHDILQELYEELKTIENEQMKEQSLILVDVTTKLRDYLNDTIEILNVYAKKDK